jgi:hypothetical protein
VHSTRIAEHELLMKVLPDLTQLALWHAFDRVAKGDASLEFALDAWTMVWFFCPWHLSPEPPETPRNDRALYKRIIHDVQGLLEKHRQRLDSRRFSEESFAYLDPLFAEYDREHYRNPPRSLSWFGCIGYNTDPRDPTRAALHFYNACCPGSPFEDMDALFDDMRQCVRHLRDADPRVQRVSCGSWINNLQPFLSLFPACYASDLVVSDPNAKSGMGWWGQFVRRDGTLNEERADELRRTGRFHYERKRGECALAELVDHVDAHYS